MKAPYRGQKLLWTMWLSLILSICFYVLELKTAILTGRTFADGTNLDQVITQEFGTGAIENMVFLSYGAVGVGIIAVMIYTYCNVLALMNRNIQVISSYAPRRFSPVFFKVNTLGIIAVLAMMVISYGGVYFLPAHLYPFTDQSYMDAMFILGVGLFCGVLGLRNAMKLHRRAVYRN